MNAVKTYFLDVITKHYFDFNGRADRKQFWLYQLFYFIAFVCVNLLVIPLGEKAGVVVKLLITLALFLPSLGIIVRRLHDINLRGWWVLLNLVPFLGSLVLFVFWLLPGTEGKNRFN